MKKLIFVFLFSALVLFSTARAGNFSSENYPDADRLFAWAEKQYPTLFAPSNGISQVWEGWYYRFYPNTKNYAGVNTEGSVYVTGQSFDGLLYIDTLQTLLAEVDKIPVKTGRLNDTGIVSCANLDTIELACPVNDFSGQDAEYGRDVTHNDNSNGHAGFSFTKLDNDGNPIPTSAIEWSCVRDNVTGLVWEVKTNYYKRDDNRDRLRNANLTYSWYSSTSLAVGLNLEVVGNNGGPIGVEYGGNCSDANNCDTEKYIQQVNSLSFCGANDWRLPTVDELLGIVSFDRVEPAIDTDYFPFTRHRKYWSDNYVWTVGFNSGSTNRGYNINDNFYVRLVRTGQ